MQINPNDLIQVVSALGSCIAAVAAYRECRLFGKQLRQETYWQQNEKSVEFARFFAERIIPKSSYVDRATKPSEVLDKVRIHIVDKNLCTFDAEEFQRYTNSSPDEVYSSLKRESQDISSPFRKALLEAHTHLHLQSPDAAFDIQIIDHDEFKDTSTKVASEFCPSSSDMLFSEFCTIVNSLLNELEFFAMAINAGVIDGEVLFPSLHQVFFDVTRTLYWYICLSNRHGVADKYYTHVSTLYLQWREKYNGNLAEAHKLDEGVNKGFKSKRERIF